MWFEWMSPWWRDTVNLIVAITTVGAAVAAAAAIKISRDLDRKSRERLVRERQRLHDIEVLGDLAEVISQRNGWDQIRHRSRSLYALLTRGARYRLRWVARWNGRTFEDVLAALDERGVRRPGMTPSNVGNFRVAPPHTFYDVMMDEITDAIRWYVNQADDDTPDPKGPVE